MKTLLLLLLLLLPSAVYAGPTDQVDTPPGVCVDYLDVSQLALPTCDPQEVAAESVGVAFGVEKGAEARDCNVSTLAIVDTAGSYASCASDPTGPDCTADFDSLFAFSYGGAYLPNEVASRIDDTARTVALMKMAPIYSQSKSGRFAGDDSATCGACSSSEATTLPTRCALDAV